MTGATGLDFERLILLKGYHPGHNFERDYQDAKRPIRGKSWTNVNGDGEAWEAEGGWIGGAIPEGLIICDIDDKETGVFLHSKLREVGASYYLMETPRGFQFFFGDTGKVETQNAKMVTAGGFLCDYRLHGKGYTVLTGRTIERVNDGRELTPMPPIFIPLKQYDRTKDSDKLLPVPITEGQRDDTLFQHACRIRNLAVLRGTKLDLERTLQEVNQLFCDPPLSPHEVTAKVRSAERYDEPKLRNRMEVLRPEILDSDLANAERLVRMHGEDLRHTPERGWFTWNGHRWEPDEALALRKAKDTARAIFNEIKDSGAENQKALFSWARRSQSAERLRAMLFLAESEPSISAHVADFDRDPMLLNCLNGTLDLRTGNLREHRSTDLISKIIPVRYDPEAPCETWKAFLDKVMAGNQALISYLQRAIGYSLTGDTGAQCLFFLYGTGANGKSVLLETVQALLGEYGLSTLMDAFSLKQRGSIPNDIARLAGARFVAVSETGEDQRMNETLVKDLTGGDTITARFLHREFFDFRPQFKLWIRGNHKPQIRGTDDGIWRRIHLIPFQVQISEAERDPALPEKLRAELHGILSWAVQGCLEWQKTGLRPPEEVRTAVREYRTEMDILGAFIEECCVIEPHCKATSGELYRAYMEWAKASGEHPVSQTRFGTALGERGFQKGRSGGTGTRFYRGIGLSVTGVTGSDRYSKFSPYSRAHLEENPKTPSQPVTPVTIEVESPKCTAECTEAAMCSRSLKLAKVCGGPYPGKGVMK